MNNKKIVVDLHIKENNGIHLRTLDKIKNIDINRAIELLKIKYSSKGLFSNVCKAFNIAAEEFDSFLKR